MCGLPDKLLTIVEIGVQLWTNVSAHMVNLILALSDSS